MQLLGVVEVYFILLLSRFLLRLRRLVIGRLFCRQIFELFLFLVVFLVRLVNLRLFCP